MKLARAIREFRRRLNRAYRFKLRYARTKRLSDHLHRHWEVKRENYTGIRTCKHCGYRSSKFTFLARGGNCWSCGKSQTKRKAWEWF